MSYRKNTLSLHKYIDIETVKTITAIKYYKTHYTKLIR